MESYMESYNNCNATTCTSTPPVVTKEENVKMLLDELNNILKEIYLQLDLIDDAIHGNKLDSTTSDSNIVSSTLPMLADIREKKFLAEKILKITVHIKEGLW